jgi:hypothetical protein
MATLLRNLTKASLTLELAQEILTDLGNKIHAAGGIYHLTKDDLKKGLRGLTDVSFAKPTSFAEDVLSMIYNKFPSLSDADPLIDSCYTPSHEFSQLLNNRYSTMSRHFIFANDNINACNLSKCIQAIMEFDVSNRKDLQSIIPLSLTKILNIERLSVPGLYSVACLWGMHEFGVTGGVDTYNIARFSSALLPLPMSRKMEELVFCGPDVVSNHVNKNDANIQLKDWVSANEGLPDEDYKNALSKPPLIRAAVGHFSLIDESFSQCLNVILNNLSNEYNALKLRDMANALFITHQFKENFDDVQIPRPIAKALGGVFATPAPIEHPTGPRKNELVDRVANITKYDMPIWDTFISVERDRQTFEQDVATITDLFSNMSEQQRKDVLRYSLLLQSDISPKQ